MRRALASISILAIASTARAQIETPPMDMAGAMLNREAMRVQLGAVAGARSAGRSTHGSTRGARAAGSTSPSSQAAAIRTTYQADPSVSVRVRRQFLDFVRRTDGPSGADALQRAFERVDPLQHWAQIAAEDGMRLGDLGDALAEYWVQNWEIANGVEGVAPAKVRAVRAQVQNTLARSAAFARLSEVQRQAWAELLIYNMSVQGEVYGSALKSGDRALLARLGDAAQARVKREMNIDVRRLVLANAGFVTRG